MTSMRENPIRRQRSRRPPWLPAVLIGVGAIVVVGLVFAIVTLVRGGSDEGAAEPGALDPSPCVTTMVPASEILPPASKVRVNVYNATTTSGLAGTIAKELFARKFKIVRIANDPVDKKINGVAQIRFGAKGEASAQLLLLHVPGAELINDGRRGRNVDLAMGETFAGLAPTQGVEAQLAKPTPVASGSGCAADATG